MSDTARVKILDAYRDRVQAKFGPNTQREYFRKVVRGLWLPSNRVFPACYIVDDGQKKAMTGGDAEDSKEQILTVKLCLHLAENWEREDAIVEWSNRVQEIALDPVVGIQNWLPPYGCIRNDYTGDEPFTALIGAGSQAELWILEFEVLYFVETGELGKD